jgi:hypothetical protein
MAHIDTQMPIDERRQQESKPKRREQREGDTYQKLQAG